MNSKLHGITNGCQTTLEDKVSKVFAVFDVTFKKYKLSEIFLSFNGGKDCTVLLHLVISFLKKNSTKFINDKKLNIIYIQSIKPFDEVEKFVDSCENYYNTKITRIKGKLRDVLENICEQNVNLKATIMGCRRTDPYCEDLETFQSTDPNWPPLLRVNPLLDWCCKDIWDYIKANNIPYCSLYDDGYTSIGDQTNTQKNPHLKYSDENDAYKPAYELLDDKLERAGRL